MVDNDYAMVQQKIDELNAAIRKAQEAKQVQNELHEAQALVSFRRELRKLTDQYIGPYIPDGFETKRR